MSLRRRARLVVLMALVIVTGLCGAFLTIRLQKTQIEQAVVLIDALIIDSIQLRAVFFDYLLYREDRPRRQAEAKFADLHAVLENQAQFIAANIEHEPLTQIPWENVRRSLAESEALFAEQVDQEAASRPERARRTTDLLLLSGQSLLLSLSQIHRIAVNKLLEAHNQEETMLWILLAGLTGLGLSLFLLLQKGVLAPLQRLREATTRIADGQADLRLRSPRRDEFGQLAQSFDHMLDQLQETTVSRDRLEVEIGQRQQAETAVRLAHARFQRLVDANIVGIVVTNAQGDILEANDYYLNILGYTREELVEGAVRWIDLTPAEWLPADDKALAELVERGICTPYEKEYRRKDGSRRAVFIADALLPGPEDHILAIVLDITERRQAEMEIHRLNTGLEERVRQRTAELVAANQELDSFTYAVSHDLRAPLRAMSGFSQALLEDYGERLDGEARGYLDQIVIASRHMSELIDGLLVLSRSARSELRRERVGLAALAERLLAEQAAAEPERQVVWQVEPNLSAQGDPMMLEVVMRNLIENAWKYTAKTPNATIRVYAEKEGERCFCVADNGTGFDMSHANRLFKAFQRLHRQDEFPGIGIGLATVQRIIHRHGGGIRAEGAPGRGAIFRFTLPTVETPSKETA